MFGAFLVAHVAAAAVAASASSVVAGYLRPAVDRYSEKLRFEIGCRVACRQRVVLRSVGCRSRYLVCCRLAACHAPCYTWLALTHLWAWVLQR